MARLNVLPDLPPTRTHEGAPAARLTPLLELRRSVLTALLWESQFYASGSAHAARVESLVPRCRPADVAALAVEARERMYLRHVPLFLVRQLARVAGNGTLVADTLARVIQRPDELTEYLALYWQGAASHTSKRPTPLSAGSKRGLARAFAKFSAYQLAKYDREGAVRLRDVLRLTHAKPKDTEQAALWKRVIARDLASPDTWEVALSAGADKRETFERLLREDKLGGLAFLRNLRNMVDAKVDPSLVRARFSGSFAKVLPFRFLAAVRHAPAFAAELDAAMLRAVSGEVRMEGRTAVLVDVSGSMDAALSRKSEMTRVDAACGLAVLVRELCAECRIFSFSNQAVEVPGWRGLALAKAITDSQTHGGTYLGAAMQAVSQRGEFDLMIVITDEQSHDRVSAPAVGRGYVINVGAYQHGVGYGGPWTHIDGWSERVMDFIRESEAA